MLFAVTGGLFAMHTLGHLREHSTAGPADSMMSVVAAPLQAVHSVDATTGHIGSGHGPSMPTDPAILRLAILCATVLLPAAIAVLLRRARPAQATLRPLSPGAFGNVRGPPAHGIGLRLADLAVLRN